MRRLSKKLVVFSYHDSHLAKMENGVRLKKGIGRVFVVSLHW